MLCCFVYMIKNKLLGLQPDRLATRPRFTQTVAQATFAATSKIQSI